MGPQLSCLREAGCFLKAPCFRHLFACSHGTEGHGTQPPLFFLRATPALQVGGIVAAGSRVSGIGKGVGPAPDLRADPALDKRAVAGPSCLRRWLRLSRWVQGTGAYPSVCHT